MISQETQRAAYQLVAAIVRNEKRLPQTITLDDPIGREVMIKVEFAPVTIVGISLGAARSGASLCRDCGGTGICQACGGTGEES